MRIVLPGALPDPREARELAVHLQKTAPTLSAWLQTGQARSVSVEPTETGCTPFEQWQLQTRGFKPTPGQLFAAGLGPLYHEHAEPAEQAVWLVELVHVSPSRDGAALLPANEIAISAEHSVALFASVQALFADEGMALHQVATERWRVELKADYAPQCAGPQWVSMSSVNEWWPQSAESRRWRRLANEVQMMWFDHPVNKERYSQGLVPVNSLWLFGGARPDQFTLTNKAYNDTVYHDLLPYSRQQDWAGWLDVMGTLESEVFKPLGTGQAPGLVLIGSNRIVEVNPTAFSRLKQWLPGNREAWRKWWSPQD